MSNRIPFDDPVQALLMLGFGLAIWAGGKHARHISQNKDWLSNSYRNNPWSKLFSGKPMTAEEISKNLPSNFMQIYGWAGRTFQWIGLAFMSWSLIILALAILKKFII